MASLHDRVVDAVVTIIKGLALDGMIGGVERIGDVDAVNVELPCVLVTLRGEQERLLGGTTLTRHRAYPVRVMIVSSDEVSLQDEAKIATWRAAIFDAFDRRKRQSDGLVLPECSEVYVTTITPRPVLDENLKQYKYAVSGLVVEAEAVVAR